MLLREIRELTDAEVLTGQDMIDTYTVKSVYASDLMSDVLAQVKGHPLLITGLCNPQVMRTAEMMDISCVLFVRGKCPDEHVLELAQQEQLARANSNCKSNIPTAVFCSGRSLQDKGAVTLSLMVSQLQSNGSFFTYIYYIFDFK